MITTTITLIQTSGIRKAHLVLLISSINDIICNVTGPLYVYSVVPRDDDIIINTSYKSGTTWTQTIIANLIFQGICIHSFLYEYIELTCMYNGVYGCQEIYRGGVILLSRE